jgi:RNA polymerase sigma-70 factor (ECF subfamily)
MTCVVPKAGHRGTIVEIEGAEGGGSAAPLEGKPNRELMAVRARPDNLALDHPATVEPVAAPLRFEELWEHRDDLQAMCRRMVGDDGLADDVVQETFLRALTRAQDLDRRVSFAPWLATVARRRSIDQLRADARARPVATVPERAGLPADEPLEQILQQERIDRVRAALAELSTRERQLLLRQIAHGLSLAELAAEEATSIASVRSVLSRARNKLRLALERGGPLGAAPAAGLLAAVKRRLHRWAVRLEGTSPMLAGAGAQFGDAVVAAVVAVVLFLSGGTPSAEPPSTQLVSALAADSHGADGARPRGGEPGPTKATGTVATTTTTSTTSTPTTTTVPSSAWSPLDDPPGGDDVPWIPDEGSAQPEGAAIQSFALAPDGETVFAAATSTTGTTWPIYRSDDGGETWQKFDAKGYFGGNLLVSSSVLFAVTPGSFPLMRSDDGGETFQPVAPARGTATLLPQSPGDQHAKVLFATPQLFVYDSGSRASTPVGVGPGSVVPSSVAVPLDYATNPVVLVGASRTSMQNVRDTTSVVHRCTSTSCTEAVLSGAATEPKLYVPRHISGLVLAAAGTKLFRSTDDGATFSEATLPTGVRANYLADGDAGELLLASIGMGGTGGGLYRSTDDGETWSKLETGSALDTGARSVVRTASGRLIAGAYPVPGLLCSDDDGASWAPRCSS